MTGPPSLLPRLVNRPLAMLPAFALSPYAERRDTAPGVAATVALIPIVGGLTNDEWGWGMQSYGSIRTAFCAALHADDVAAIALLIDSPGGEVAGCFDLAEMIFQARGTKPIRAILTETAFSAAYALASAADHIDVPRTGYTGSVGVIKLHADMSKMLGAAGIDITILQYGDRKSDGNPFEPLSKEAVAGEMAELADLGNLFVETVARNRGLKASAVKATEAATFMGAAGVSIGFADSVTAPDAAFADLLSTL